jgi:prolyl 4-hydroxylase
MESVRHALDLAENGRVSAAFEFLSNEVRRGNAEAAFLLARWRLAGDLIRRDLGEARRLFGVAFERGFEQAKAPYIALLANGAGGTDRRWTDALDLLKSSRDDVSRRQSDILEKMDLDELGNPTGTPRPEAALKSIPVWTLPGFLSEDESAFLCASALPRLQPSMVVHPISGAMVTDPVRRSSATAFPFIDENPVLHAVNRRIAAATGTAYEQGEPSQILCYDSGQEYRNHSDALPSTSNQRAITLLVYLTDNYDGGETYFPAVKWSYRGSIGDALLFSNIDECGRPNPLTVHAGLPVTKGRKMVLSKWIRSKPLDLQGPSGRPF